MNSKFILLLTVSNVLTSFDLCSDIFGSSTLRASVPKRKTKINQRADKIFAQVEGAVEFGRACQSNTQL